MADIETRIVTTSAELIKKYGHRSVSMDDVASKIGISKKTLYEYFPSKEELLVASVELLIENYMTKVNAIQVQDAHPLLKILRIYWNLLEDLFSMDIVYIHNINRHQKKVLKVVDLFRNELISEYVKPLMLEAYSKDCLRPELDIDLFLNFRLRNIDQHYLTLKSNTPNISFKECFNHLVAYQISGICGALFQEKHNELVQEVLG